MAKKSICVCMFILALFLTATVSALPLTPANLWNHRFGSTGYDGGSSVAVDASGNLLVTGTFQGTVNFGGGNLASAGVTDIFVAKYDAAGAHQWSQRLGGFGLDYGDLSTSVAVDASGNVFVTGTFEGTGNFGGSNLVSAGATDIFVAKYDAAGVHQWSQRFGSTSYDAGYSVAVDASGNLLVTGTFGGTVNFGGGNRVSAGATDIFVAKYDAAGVHQWSQRFGSTNDDGGHSVAVDASGNLVVTGTFRGTVNFGGSDLASAGASDIFVAKYDAAGVHQWSQRFGGSSFAYGDYSASVAVDASGNVLVTGTFEETGNFGGSDLVSAGATDIFVAKYNAGGVHQWSQRFGSIGGDGGQSVAVNVSGDVFVTGTFQYVVNFGGGNLVSAGSTDLFLAKYSGAGIQMWSQRFGSTGYDGGSSVMVDGSSNAVVTGSFEEAVNFGGGDLVSAGLGDIFLAKFARSQQEPLITSITDIGNDQGRRVRIEISCSGLDAEVASPVTTYEAYRRNDALAAPIAETPAGTLSRTQLLDQGWVYAGDVPAHGVDVYLMDAPTDADSTITLGQHYSAFFIRAATADPLIFFDSPIDSGWSLDNLAPGVPGGFAYNSGVLSWKKSTAVDFKFFSIYGSSNNSFASATLVDYCVTPTMDVTASPCVFYFVTATDFSGNEGKPAVVNTLTGAGGTPTNYVLSISSYPNPFNPTTTIRYTVPSKGQVNVAIYDARGAHVATLVDAEKSTGAYVQAWNGRDNAGRRVSSGVYFARVTHPSGTRIYKTVLIK